MFALNRKQALLKLPYFFNSVKRKIPSQINEKGFN